MMLPSRTQHFQQGPSEIQQKIFRGFGAASTPSTTDPRFQQDVAQTFSLYGPENLNNEWYVTRATADSIAARCGGTVVGGGASAISNTPEPYNIRFPDGFEVNAGLYLQQLDKSGDCVAAQLRPGQTVINAPSNVSPTSAPPPPPAPNVPPPVQVTNPNQSVPPRDTSVPMPGQTGDKAVDQLASCYHLPFADTDSACIGPLSSFAWLAVAAGAGLLYFAAKGKR